MITLIKAIIVWLLTYEKPKSRYDLKGHKTIEEWAEAYAEDLKKPYKDRKY